ncbi:pentatricopeptide repeat-containing protein At5g39680-like [Ananas comosus]|uniref:Pentatricopeptide repeat-containing protein At5g39680-like n=1 Tax=Ananas comosus TaxID=4615 RepID=A0A6P5GE10_ANACO|nr:pentatricopeptide repeat-containing protein At5g39680-like [Ananas comosus]
MRSHSPIVVGFFSLLSRRMSSSLFQPPIQTSPTIWRTMLINLLQMATESQNLTSGKVVHAQVIRTLEFDIIHANYLINLYVKCGRLDIARHVFDVMPERNVVSGNALMVGYFHSGYPFKAVELFKSIDFGELADGPNEYIFTTALSACANIGAHEEGRQCHAYVLKSGLVLYAHVRNSLLHMYSKCSGMEDALGVFKALPSFDVFAFNSMINGFLDHGQLTQAVALLSCMVKEIVRWDHVSFIAVLGLCAGLKDSTLGRQVHCQILKRRMEFSVFVGSAIIDMYGKCGDAQNAQIVFEMLQNKNVVSWTAVMAACAQNECFEDALKLFLKMEIDGISPNEFTYAVALNSCAGLSALRNGDALNAHIEKSGYKSSPSIDNALINMYSKSGSIEDAMRVFTTMSHHDIISWNSIITAYSHHGLAREALEAFNNMLAAAEVPTYVTFIGVLSACGHLGLVDEAFYYLNHSMQELGIKPGIEHYTCIVGLLCRAGLLNEADWFMRSTGTDWDIVAWRTLLSACQVHKNYGLGHRVANHIIELNPSDVGTYILLSNLYAKENRWDGVVKIRKIMRERYIKKEPGVSWIQVGSVVHVFTSEDKKHPWMTQINEKLAELIGQIKLIGYVPNIDSVLHDVEDEQKEEYLRYHSEKLAIAFGLIRTPQGAPIHVMKNLRICDDCHVAIKLISIVTKRRMVLRDASRFHRFEGGVCSCDDYW